MLKLTAEMLGYLWLLFKINTKAAFSLKASFVASAVFMLLNNFCFFIFWLLIFARVDEIGGWRLPDVALMFGLAAGAYGLAMLLGAGSVHLARYISEGELDIYLTQPKPLLLSALGSRTVVAGWGDLISGLIFVGLSGYHSPLQITLALLCCLSGALLFVFTAVLLHSSAFWLGPVNQLARTIGEFVVTFSLYPGPIYSGWLRVLIFTILPAGFITVLPVAAIRAADIGTGALVLMGTAVYCAFALWVFHRGLRRYESGNHTILRA